ncbi:hypothetical protein M501DRAFT_406088 [Patellaria atrata CBS 101060]|uniref:F-box domain-containing protein n=1 Tax=Patellaria atrata CBS 101060 TaxID=1346257 RepID=A0A9P4VW36_9PEZI|nr:hypothetical protein M501DRAFT_406088 [Patellaria atrata CBS 101060]
MATLERLPTELLLLIISHLHLRKFVSFAQTSRRHYTLCTPECLICKSKRAHYRKNASVWTCISEYPGIVNAREGCRGLEYNFAPQKCYGILQLLNALLHNLELREYVMYLQLRSPQTCLNSVNIRDVYNDEDMDEVWPSEEIFESAPMESLDTNRETPLWKCVVVLLLGLRELVVDGKRIKVTHTENLLVDKLQRTGIL